MAKKRCEECIGWSFEMPKKLDAIIFDYQTEIRDKEKVSLNKFQILFKIINQWKTTRSLWKRVNPNQENGEYMPEGTNVLMYNENTKEIKVGLMYSSMGMCTLKGVTHWMPLPEYPST